MAVQFAKGVVLAILHIYTGIGKIGDFRRKWPISRNGAR